MNPNNTQLTSRQIEILKFKANGYIYKQIASELGICEDTVKEHISLAVQKLQVNTVTEVIVHLVRENII